MTEANEKPPISPDNLRNVRGFLRIFLFWIRTVRSEYLVAMKLVSGRQYKKDLSDIAGIVYEQQMAGKNLLTGKNFCGIILPS